MALTMEETLARKMILRPDFVRQSGVPPKRGSYEADSDSEWEETMVERGLQVAEGLKYDVDELAICC